MYSFNFIVGYIIIISLIGMVMINSFRRFIITYRIFGKAKKRDFHKVNFGWLQGHDLVLKHYFEITCICWEFIFCFHGLILV